MIFSVFFDKQTAMLENSTYVCLKLRFWPNWLEFNRSTRVFKLRPLQPCFCCCWENFVSVSLSSKLNLFIDFVLPRGFNMPNGPCMTVGFFNTLRWVCGSNITKVYRVKHFLAKVLNMLMTRWVWFWSKILLETSIGEDFFFKLLSFDLAS